MWCLFAPLLSIDTLSLSVLALVPFLACLHLPAGSCQYPFNAFSNKRWCCNDHSDAQGTHFDMSLW